MHKNTFTRGKDSRWGLTAHSWSVEIRKDALNGVEETISHCPIIPPKSGQPSIEIDTLWWRRESKVSSWLYRGSLHPPAQGPGCLSHGPSLPAHCITRSTPMNLESKPVTVSSWPSLAPSWLLPSQTLGKCQHQAGSHRSRLQASSHGPSPQILWRVRETWNQQRKLIKLQWQTLKKWRPMNCLIKN